MTATIAFAAAIFVLGVVVGAVGLAMLLLYIGSKTVGPMW